MIAYNATPILFFGGFVGLFVVLILLITGGILLAEALEDKGHLKADDATAFAFWIMTAFAVLIACIVAGFFL